MNKNKRLSKWLRGTQTNPANGGASMKKEEFGSRSQSQLKQESQSSNILHQSCQTLTLDRFISIMVSGSLRFLIIKGNPTDEELSEAWESIVSEYSDLVKTNQSDNVFEVYKRIIHTQWQIGFIDLLLEELAKGYDEDIAKELADVGYTIVEKDTWKEYFQQITRVKTEAKYLIVQLNQFTNEYQMLMKDEPDAVKRSPAEYEKEIAILSKFQGFRIVKEKTTVAEYCGIINAFIDYHKAQKN